MKQVEIQSLIPPEPTPPAEKTVHSRVLGKSIVEGEEKAVYHDFAAERLEGVVNEAEALREAKVMPRRKGVIRQQVARFTGKLMTPQEAYLVNYANSAKREIDFETTSAESERRYGKTKLSWLRRGLESLDLGMLQEMAFSIYCASAGEFFKSVKQQQSPESSWRTWLSTEASDEYLINFLQWHVNTMEQRAIDPEVQQKHELSRKKYKESLAVGIREGWLHEDAQEAIAKTDEIHIYEGDIFDTFLKDIGGYHTAGSKDVVLGLAVGQASVNHELNHAVLGDFSSRWRREAATEHIASALTFGAPEVMDPDKRNDERHIYTEERALFAALLSEGQEIVPVRLMTRAYSESLDSDAAKNELEAAIDKAWRHILPNGASATELLDNYVNELENKLLKQGETLSQAEVHALNTALSDLQTQPEIIFSSKTAYEQAGSTSDTKETTREIAALQTSMVAFEQLLSKLLVNGQGFMRQPSPEIPSSMLTSTREVDSEIAALRSQGQSEKKAIRTVVKRYHSDTNQNKGAREKIRAANRRLDEFNRREGEKNANG